MRRSSARTVLFSEAVASRVGIHPTDLETLEILARDGPLTAGRLAALTGLTSAATTSLIDRLERSGFARRARDPLDRRKVVVELDRERAERAILPLYEGLTSAFARIADRLTDEQLALIRDFLAASSESLAEETRRLRGGDQPR
ncbi:MAG TPA: MarR family transcriptional regulator [Candidatus Limnocylindria bacterium]|nr:MarR family transcriptional regulator [Candidatus Limnocylindria bacterium]